MEPMLKSRPARPSGVLLLSTGAVLVIAFLSLIVLFFVFSSLTPALMGRCVAVVDINNELAVDGTPASLFSAGTPGSEEIAKTIEDIGKRDDVGAVLFVVNSPGGSVVATREIYNAVKGLKKPKVAYFREVAASGAYYLSTGTDYIISDPDAVTGSIGVIATFTEMSGLLDKIGVNITSITSGPHKDIGSSYRNMTADERQILQGLIDEVYGEFRSVVLENRQGRLDLSKFDNVSDGRILSGRQALKVGLVDAVGTKKDAIMKAAELAGIDAASPDDVRLCPVTVTTQDAGLFSAEAFIRSLEAKASAPSLDYK